MAEKTFRPILTYADEALFKAGHILLQQFPVADSPLSGGDVDEGHLLRLRLVQAADEAVDPDHALLVFQQAGAEAGPSAQVRDLLFNGRQRLGLLALEA